MFCFDKHPMIIWMMLFYLFINKGKTRKGCHWGGTLSKGTNMYHFLLKWQCMCECVYTLTYIPCPGCASHKSPSTARCYCILSKWANISKECFQHLVESMPLRIKAVLKIKH